MRNQGGGEAHAAARERLAVVYADELRMKIATEAYMREISPKLFYSQFGGGSVPRVAQHFDRLVEADWLSLARIETGGPRRGAVEHFYRATELVVFEDDVWATLPGSVRAAFSWVTFEQFTERVSAAIISGSFNMKPDRHLSWTPVLVDEIGWKRLIAQADAVFRTATEEQERAKLRIAESGGESFIATVALAVFESPMWLRHQRAWRDRPYASAPTTEVTAPLRRSSFYPMLARICTNPLDLQIIDKLNRREMSPKLLHNEMPEVTLAGFDRRLKKLSGQGWATEVRQKTGGNRRRAEHFYRAVGPALIDNESWAEIPDPIKATITSRTFEHFREKVKEAIDVGTFDRRIDRHLSWSLLRLDPIGWEKIISLVDGFFESLFDEEKGAKQRMAKSGEKPNLVTIGLAGFESSAEIARAL